jgi:hypothetical protein
MRGIHESHRRCRNGPISQFRNCCFCHRAEGICLQVHQGASARYDEAEWSVKVLNEKLDLTFAGLNPQQGKAQLIGNAGASDLRFWKGAWTWNFVEVTDTGNVTTTTVFDASNGKDFPAVHSRHTSVVGEPLPSQYRGICAAKT